MEKERSGHPGLVAASGTVLAPSPPTLQALGAHRVGHSAVGRAVPATGLSVGSGDPRSWIGVPAGGRWGALPWLRFCFVCDSDGRGLHASLVRAFPRESGRCTHHGYLTGTHVLEVPPPARGHKAEAWLGWHHWLLCCHQTPVAPFRRSPSSPPSIQGVLGGPGLVL